MDGNRIDSLSRMLATGVSGRAALKSATVALLGTLGLRTGAEAQVSVTLCNDVRCRNNPERCLDGCVCCVFANGTNRCVPDEPEPCPPFTTRVGADCVDPCSLANRDAPCSFCLATAKGDVVRVNGGVSNCRQVRTSDDQCDDPVVPDRLRSTTYFGCETPPLEGYRGAAFRE